MDELEHLKKEARHCEGYLIERAEKSKKSSKRLKVLTYVSLSLSLALDFIPAFIPALQTPYYSIPTVVISLGCLLFDMYRDSAGHEIQIVKDGFMQEKFRSIANSIDRVSEESNGTCLSEYSKRMHEKLALSRVAAGEIPNFYEDV